MGLSIGTTFGCNREMEKYFYIEHIEDPKRVKFFFLKLKGHASLWWDKVHDDRVKKGKEKKNTWDKWSPS